MLHKLAQFTLYDMKSASMTKFMQHLFESHRKLLKILKYDKNPELTLDLKQTSPDFDRWTKWWFPYSLFGLEKRIFYVLFRNMSVEFNSKIAFM